MNTPATLRQREPPPGTGDISAAHMTNMKKSSVHDQTVPIIFARPTPAAETTPETATCDKVRDPLKDNPEFAGRAVWTCNKPAGHDNRGAHRMVDAQGRTTEWRGADND